MGGRPLEGPTVVSKTLDWRGALGRWLKPGSVGSKDTTTGDGNLSSAAVGGRASRCEGPRQQSATGAQDERGGDALIDAHPAGDEIRGFAQRLQEKAAQSIPGQHAQRVISGR